MITYEKKYQFLFLILLNFVSLPVFAFSSIHKGTLYRCPSISDLKYRKGTFTAVTHYHDLQMRWGTNQIFPDAKVKIMSFSNTNKLANCIGGACTINCIYNTNASSQFLMLEVLNSRYRIIKNAKGPWKNDVCAAKQPEACTFYVIPNTFPWYLSLKNKQAIAFK